MKEDTEARESKTNKRKTMEITCNDGVVLRANDGSRYVIFEKLLTSTNPDYHGENGYFFKPSAVWERDSNKLLLTPQDSFNTADYQEVEGIEADFVRKSLDRWNEARACEAAVGVIKERLKTTEESLKAKEANLKTRERKLIKRFGDVEPGIQLVDAARRELMELYGNLEWVRIATGAEMVKIDAVSTFIERGLMDTIGKARDWLLSIKAASRRVNKDNSETNTEDTTNTERQ